MRILKRSLLFAGLLSVWASPPSSAGSEAVSFPSVKMWKNAETTTIRGTLSKPEGKGPFPAMVLLPNCGGPDSPEFARFWPRYLNEIGYVTLNVDPFTPRNQKRCTKNFMPKADILMQDAYGAYAYLAHLPDVDGNRVGVLGSSLGAHAINWYIGRGRSTADGLKFKAAVSLYPAHCRKVSPNRKTTPTLVILGDKERGIASCKRLQHHGLNVIVLPDTYHGFDQPSALRRKNGRLRKDINGNERLYNQSATRKAQSLVKDFLTAHLAARSKPAGLEEPKGLPLGKVGKRDPYRAVNRRDKDSDGKVSREEWDRSPNIFSRIDADGDSFLTPQEFFDHWTKRQ